VTAVSRATNLIDIFVKGTDGVVYTTWKVDGGGWNGWYNVWNAASDPYVPVAVAARPRKLDLFVIGYDGRVYHTGYDDSSGWVAWSQLGSQTFPYWGRLTTLVQHPESVDLFGVASDGKLYTAWLDTQGAWRDFYPLSQVHAGVSLPAGTPVTALGHPEGYLRNSRIPLLTLAGWTARSTTNGSTGPGFVTAINDPQLGHAFQLGTTQTFGSPTETTLSQWVTLPRVGADIDFGWESRCPDSLTFDWTTVEIHDTSGNLLATPVPRSCMNDGKVQVAKLDLRPFGGQTVELRLINHDDGYSGDPTLSLFENISIGFVNTSDAGVGSGFATGENDLFVVDQNGDILNSYYDAKD
jgi:hypothetical protein